MLGLSKKRDYPALRYIVNDNLSLLKYKFGDKNPLNLSKISLFVEGVISGKIKPYYLSERSTFKTQKKSKLIKVASNPP